MKRTHLLAAVLAFTLAMPAMATVKPPPTPTPTPPTTQPIDVDAAALAGAAAQAGAAAGAISGSTSGAASGSLSSATTGDSTSNATGGRANSGSYSAGGDGGGGGALTDNSSTRMYVLPPPVWTQVPQASGCIVTSSRAGSLLLGVVSGSKTDQKSDPVCVGVIMAKAAYDHCHFESEHLITQRIYETIFPGHPALPMAPGTRNHTLGECEELKRPRLVMSPALAPTPVAPLPAPVVVNVEQTAAAPAQACAAPVPAAKPAQRKVVKAKPAPAACPR